MPTYDYRCKACGHEFELFQGMSESVKRKCPACDELSLERLIGAGAGILFKGKGFYQTDYRSKSYKDGAQKESENGKPESKSDSKKTDSDSASGTSKGSKKSSSESSSKKKSES